MHIYFSYFSKLTPPELHFYRRISVCMFLSKKSAACELSHIFTPSHHLLIVEELRSQPVLQEGKQVVFARSEITAVRRVVKQLPAEMPQQCSSASSCIRTHIIMEEHYEYTGCQHSTPFVLHGPTQYFSVSE
jgi:hypothetical protein